MPFLCECVSSQTASTSMLVQFYTPPLLKNTHRKAKQSFESHFALFPQIALSSRWRETISLHVSGGMTPGKISGERQLQIELIHITQVNLNQG